MSKGDVTTNTGSANTVAGVSNTSGSNQAALVTDHLEDQTEQMLYSQKMVRSQTTIQAQMLTAVRM